MVLRFFKGFKDRQASPALVPLPAPSNVAGPSRPTASQSEIPPQNTAGNLYLQGDIDFDREHPINDGGYGELFAGSHASDGKVALKRLRIHGIGDDRQRYLMDTMAEARIWRTLVHPNVLTFLGILFEGREVYLVSPLVENGSLSSYISGHPDVDRAAFLRQAAEGLAYLHYQIVVHGDVKGTNILVQTNPLHAVLCDFGLSKILATSVTTTKGGLGTFRWQSPELMQGGARSFEGDMYAYGMTVYEIISDKIPFHDLTQDSAVMIAVIVRDERPSFESKSIDSYSIFRDIATRCWARLPASRPSMAEVLPLLSPPPPPPLEESLRGLSVTLRAENQRGRRSDAHKDRPNRRGDQIIASGMTMTTLEGHTSWVFSVAFSPDGSRLASGSDDITVKLWNVASGAMEVTLRGHLRAVSGVAFSPDGSRIASGSYDHTVRLWDTISGAEVAKLQGHTDDVNNVAFSPDGSRVASGSDDRTVRLWDPISGAVTARLEGHTGSVRSVAFSPDGSKLASGSEDIQLWNTTSGVILITLLGHTDWVRSVAFSPDGLRLVSGSHDATVRLWDTMSGKEVITLQGHNNSVMSIAFSPDGSQIATGSADKTVRLWDATSGAEIATLNGHNDCVWSVTFSPDGARLASGSSDNSIRVWKLQ